MIYEYTDVSNKAEHTCDYWWLMNILMYQ